MSNFNKWWSTKDAHIKFPFSWRIIKSLCNEAFHLNDDRLEKLKTENIKLKDIISEVLYLTKFEDNSFLILKEIKERINNSINIKK